MQNSTAIITPQETAENGEEQKRNKIAHLDPNRKRTEAHVIHCDTKEVILAADVDEGVEHMENYWAVGQLISVWVGKNRVIGQTSQVIVPKPTWEEESRNQVHVHIELIGEIQQLERGPKFSTCISQFPQMGCVAHRIRSTDLAAIYENDAASTITIGHLTQDNTIEAKIDFEKLLSRHFAVVGSTGVGKSTSVSLMLRKVVKARPDIRVLMLDPHNEFGSAFPNNSLVINAKDLRLPFWLFGLEELSEVIFRGQNGQEQEKEMLRDFIVMAKQQYMDTETDASGSLVRKQGKKTRVNADTPIPFRLPDLLKIIDERLGALDTKADKPLLKSLKERIETISNDARFQFMFDPQACGGDKITEVVSQIFRVPQNGKPICVMEMSGLPSEVVSSVVSVLCRMTFDLALSSEGALQTLVVCEEAHRYIPADINAGFWPTRQAIGRIAKEGRKYGVFLGIITQRPGELDPTILSQCNSFFAMRLSNRKDQEIIAGAFNSGAQSTIGFLPSISNRECIAFGEAVYSPMRMTFETVAAKDLPGTNIRENQDAVRAGRQINLDTVINKMRGGGSTRVEAIESDPLKELADPSAPIQQRGAPQPGEQVGGKALRGQNPNAFNVHQQTGGGPTQPRHVPSLPGQQAAQMQTQPTQQASQPAGMRPSAPITPASQQSGAIEQRYREFASSDQAAPVERKPNAGNEIFKAFRAK